MVIVGFMGMAFMHFERNNSLYFYTDYFIIVIKEADINECSKKRRHIYYR